LIKLTLHCIEKLPIATDFQSIIPKTSVGL
jgi:hypothetical protein